MNEYKLQLIETILVIIGYIVINYINKTLVNNSLKQHTHLQRGRRKMMIKAMYIFTLLAALVVLAAIWGLEQKEIATFVGTILTVLGIAFFAQWSLLSNVTAGFLLFIHHPLQIGDYIKIVDKDMPIEGEIFDLSFFYVHIKMPSNEIITIPNSILFQKAVSILEKP
ncbi:MAG: mechanosensitive ion channel family protein [Cytophagaceae bacterium]|jgi:small-conductance mechanosensitive channel|nr:mechanosensitive ion channel family protein [Cytophagaceae bacterium]